MQEAEAPSPVETEEMTNLPLPSDLTTIYLGGIFLLIFLTLIHTACEIVIPIVLAFILKLVLQPVLRFLETLRLPRSVASAIIILALVCGVIGMGTILSGPAASWGNKLPDGFPQLKERLHFLSKPMEKTQEILVQADNLTKGSEQRVIPVELRGTRLSDKLFTGTQSLVSGLFTTMLILFFLLASGDTFLRRLVEVLPTFRNKRQAVDISQQIEHDISRYLLTITTMNVGVGIATGIIMWLCGIDDPLLWGTLAFLLNYIPIIGPMITASIFLLVGLLTIANFWMALLPAMFYGVAHLTEALVLTPLILAKRFTLNPVLVVLALVFWYWMWGFPGAILSMPMLAIVKIICDRIHTLKAFGHFLKG